MIVVGKTLSAHQAALAKQWDRRVAAMLDSGMGTAHRWANAPNAEDPGLFADGCESMAKVLELHTTKWQAKWDCANPAAVLQGYADVRALRERAQGEVECALRRITPAALAEQKLHFKARTGTGADALRIRDMLYGTLESREHLVGLLRQAVQQL